MSWIISSKYYPSFKETTTTTITDYDTWVFRKLNSSNAFATSWSPGWGTALPSVSSVCLKIEQTLHVLQTGTNIII